MAVDFDGDRLLVILDSSTLEYDLVNDIYREWKLWLLTTGEIGNRRYPRLFRKIGGDPVGGGQIAPEFVFINNEAGWRVKKPESFIQTRITGNLVRENTDLPMIVQPDGPFTPTLEIFLTNVSNNDLAAFALAMWERAIEGQFSAEECLRLIMAATVGVGGKVNPNLFEYFNPAGTEKRISTVTDGDGARTSVTATP